MIKDALREIIEGGTLSRERARTVMEEIMTGGATGAQFGALVTALRMRGETDEEIAGFAEVMRAKALQVPLPDEYQIVDCCGTGGDNSGSFNISTAAAIVAAAAGARLAKHGNRSASSKCGSADVLEGLGVRIEATPEEVARCIREIGIGFMYAPAFHPAMRFAGPPRREIGIRTVFNLLGPLTNPARAQSQLIGVPERALVERLGRSLALMGTRHAILVHGLEGLDEVSIAGPTLVCEVRGGDRPTIETYEVTPEQFGLTRGAAAEIVGGTVENNVTIINELFDGGNGARRGVVLINAAAVLYVAGVAPTWGDGIALARQALASGAAKRKLAELVALTQSFGDDAAVTPHGQGGQLVQRA
ncbi:MAG: Anthranilate phosphoribosyltransferase [uncultured Thermomicrobiales bacterium]|uniref:Anthranilate phosphoribosyltransferase n=1 Tax=uncultured Thermomicrobiales bacterium TaxID=1645740 RepID=A0A6J4UR05_9BACT|nr:MAG: Anthranilate phosphoribosyltransferase [uncultured Thermomicrobiales bacterium]